MSAPLFVIRSGYRAEWKPAGERPVTVKCHTEMFDPGPIISVTGPGISGAFEVSARKGPSKTRQLEQAVDYCADRFGARIRALRIKATEICKRQPGYGTHHYRGDPYEAVALQQEADRLERD